MFPESFVHKFSHTKRIVFPIFSICSEFFCKSLTCEYGSFTSVLDYTPHFKFMPINILTAEPYIIGVLSGNKLLRDKFLLLIVHILKVVEVKEDFSLEIFTPEILDVLLQFSTTSQVIIVWVVGLMLSNVNLAVE